MATLTLPRTEACAVDFKRYDRRYKHTKSPVHLEIKDVVVAVIRFVDIRKYGVEGFNPFLRLTPFLCPERNDFEALRGALPNAYHLFDDGALVRHDGSSIETHWSVDHGQTHAEDLRYQRWDEDFYRWHEASSEPNTYDEEHERRDDLLSRKSSCRFSTVTNLDRRGEYFPDFTLALVYPKDGDTVFVPEGVREAGPTNLRVMVSRQKMLGQSESLPSLAYALFSGGDDYGRPLTVSAIVEAAQGIANSATIRIWDAAEKKLFPKFPAITSVFAKDVTGSPHRLRMIPEIKDPEGHLSRAGRVVNLTVREEDQQFTEAHFLATRCTSLERHGAGTRFVKLGLRIPEEGPVGLTTTNRAEGDETGWETFEPFVLIHKATDVWNLVYCIPFLALGSTNSDRMAGIPLFHLIPQIVTKQEITFAQHTFRGLPLETQRVIWATKGMSMALYRSLMAASYHIRNSTPKNETHLYAIKLPKGHSLGFLGKGASHMVRSAHHNAPILGADRSCDVLDLSYCRDKSKLGPQEIGMGRSSQDSIRRLMHVPDILDEAFREAEENQLVPAKGVVLPTRFKSERVVRL